LYSTGQSHTGGFVGVCCQRRSSFVGGLLISRAQLQRIARPGSARWRKGIVEKQASYACVPNMARPAVRSAHPRIFLAGDYTAGPYPATLESATLSGVQSAGALLKQL
jgi:hypothetical protein